MSSSIHCSSGHVGCSFKNPATTFNQKGQNFFDQYEQFMSEKLQENGSRQTQLLDT